MIRIIMSGIPLGRFPQGTQSFLKPVLAMALILLASVANAVTVLLVAHNQTSSSGAISTLITDGSHSQGQPASTAAWDWDGTTLTSTGLYSAVSSVGSSPYSATILNDQVTDLSIDTATTTAGASAYTCAEGTFLSTVGASGCGGYGLGANFSSESTTTWGPGTTTSQTIGGDDVVTSGPRNISAFDLGLDGVTGTGLAAGDQISIGTATLPGGLAVGTPGGEAMIFNVWGATDDAASGRANEPINVAALANDTLVDNITALTITSPANGTAVLNGTLPDVQSALSIDYTSAIGFSGPVTFDYTVTDATGNPDTATVTVTVTNLTPVGVDDPNAATPPVTPVLVDVLANDTLGDGPSTTVTVTADPNNGTVTTTVPVTCTIPADCSLSYTPDGGHLGVDTFTYQLTDDNGDTATAVVTVTTIDSLVAADDPNITTEIATPVVIDVLANDANVDDPDFSVDVTVLPTKGVVSGFPGAAKTCTVPADCSLTYTPDAGQVGVDTFVYQVTDQDPLGSVTSSATVTVTINDVPVVVDDPGLTANTAAATSLDVQANDSGLSNLPINVTVVAAPVHGTAIPDGGTPELVTYTSTAGYVGTDSFTYELTDGDGDTSVATALVSITVDDQPVAVDDGSVMVPGFLIPAGTTLSLDVLANDTGLSDTPLTVSLDNPLATLGTAMVTGSPGDPAVIRIDYAAGPTASPDSFGYQVTDNSGNTSSATAYVEVTNVNAPRANFDSVMTFAGETLPIDVLANDTGLDDTPVTVTITNSPTNGVLGPITGCTEPGALCEVPYTPAAGFSGTDSFRYRVTDSTLIESNIAAVEIIVTEVPNALDDTAETTVSRFVTIAVLDNDEGLSSPPFKVTISGDPHPDKGTVAVESDNIIYTAIGDEATTDTFDYTVTDSNGQSSMARVTVTIEPKDSLSSPFKSSSSAFGPVGLGLLILLPWLRSRRRRS